MDSRCATCGAPFQCNPGPACWCAQLPRLPMPERMDEGCVCPACLKTRLTENAAAHLPKI